MGAGADDDRVDPAMGSALRKVHRRHLPLGVGVFVVVVVVSTVMWVHAPVAGGVTRSFRLSDNSIALTFDDGPDPVHTPQVLDILREHDAHATFFVVGSAAVRHPELIARIIGEGHEVAFHTQTHPHVDRLDAREVHREIDAGLSALHSLGVKPTWYRPPRGRLTAVQKTLAAERGMKVALWARCMERAHFSTAQELATTLAEETRRGDVILAHDGMADRSMTVEALPAYLQALRARGIAVVTLSQLEDGAPLSPVGVARAVPGHAAR